jgi:CheY-like chemotaxis protein
MKGSYTILYIDDDDDDLMIVADAFERYTTNLRIIHAHNGFEGLRLLKEMAEEKKLPCLIILDINMPVVDGKQTLIEIRKNSDYNDIPMALFTTSNNPADRKIC